MVRTVSMLPAATEIVGALGLMGDLVGVSHECDYPAEANHRPRITHCEIYGRGLPSADIDRWVSERLRAGDSLYTLDEVKLRELAPELILTQRLCDVCAPAYGSVAALAAALPSQPRVLNLEPRSLRDILRCVRDVATAMGRADRATDAQSSAEWEEFSGRRRSSWNGPTRSSTRDTGRRSWSDSRAARRSCLRKATTRPASCGRTCGRPTRKSSLSPAAAIRSSGQKGIFRFWNHGKGGSDSAPCGTGGSTSLTARRTFRAPGRESWTHWKCSRGCCIPTETMRRSGSLDRQRLRRNRVGDGQADKSRFALLALNPKYRKRAPAVGILNDPEQRVRTKAECNADGNR